jgi:hypothetical protein
LIRSIDGWSFNSRRRNIDDRFFIGKRRSIHIWMVDSDTKEEDIDMEIEVADSGNEDEQENPPNDDGQEKDHRRRPTH